MFQSSLPFTLTVNEPGVLPPSFKGLDPTAFQVGQVHTLPIATSPGAPTTTTVTEMGKLPAGVTFVPGKNGTATITGKPAANTGGQYPITLIASNGLRQTTQTYTLTVDQPPAITSPSSGTMGLGQNGAIVIKTTGFPAPVVSTTDTLPTGLSLVNVGGVWMLTGTPTGSPGTTTLHLVASNNIVADFHQTFILKVVQSPTFKSLDTTAFQVGQVHTLTIATSPGVPATTTVTQMGKLPAGLTFVPGKNGTATITGQPAANTGGQYPITLIASNGTSQTTQQYTLTVNQLPAITGGTSISLTVGEVGLFAVKTTGFPHPGLQSAGGSLPPGMQFIDNGDGTGEVTGVPEVGSAGKYTFQIVASTVINGVRMSTPAKSYTLVVTQSPIFTPVNTATFTTGVAPSFTIHTSASPTVILSETGTLPKGIQFVDNHDGTAKFVGKPAAGSHGTYVLVITASDGVLPTALQVLTVTVG